MNNISLTITSNFLNHYSLSLSNEMKKYFKEFHFIVKEKLPEERMKLGFANLNDLDFVVKEYEEPEKVEKLILESDVVITDYTFNKYVKKRLSTDKLTFVDSERLFKTSNIVGTILRYVYYWKNYHMYKKANLLCISAYSAGDYNSIGLFCNRTFKWGYFPENTTYDIEKLIKGKKKNSFIWAGRLIEWKHPEYCVTLAKNLKGKGITFDINIVGNGEMFDYLKQEIEKNNLGNEVHLLGSMPPEKVRKYMEESGYYLFTSDRGEGWGVVLNEAMNSGCVCVSSFSAGSTPFLIEDGVNGIVYKEDDCDKMCEKILSLIHDDKKIYQLQINAYKRINKEYNPSVAAERFFEACNQLLNDKSIDNLYESGILSVAKPIK